jgi:hypothetical protein
MSWFFYSKEGKLLYDVVAGSVGDAATLDGIDSTGFVQIGAPGLNTGDVDLDGSLTLPVIGTSVNLPLTSAHRTVLVNSSAGSITVTLPASPLTGQTYEIRDAGNLGSGDSVANPITIGRANAVHRINGQLADYLINIDGKSVVLVFDGSGWHIISDAQAAGTGGVDADTLDTLDSTQFLRSDAADTAAGSITFNETTQFDKSTYNPVDTTNSNLALTDIHRTVLVDPNGATRTITLPAGPPLGRWYEIRDVGGGGVGTSSTYPITVARNGALIDGAPADLVINTDGDSVTLVYDSTGWYTLAKRFSPVAITAALDDLTNVTAAGAAEGELLRYDTPANEWVTTPNATLDDLGRLHLIQGNSSGGISIGDNSGSPVTLTSQAPNTLYINGRSRANGTPNDLILVLENGVVPATDTYDVAIPADNTLLCNTSAGDLFIRLPNALNMVYTPTTGDIITIKDIEGSAGLNILSVVAEGVKRRNIPVLTLDSPVGVANATTTVTPGGIGVDEVQNFMVTGAGTYNINFAGQITSGLTQLSTAAAVQSAINALSPHPSYGHFSVSVSGVDALGGLLVTFNGGALVDGQADYYLSVPYQGVKVIYHAGNWYFV